MGMRRGSSRLPEGKHSINISFVKDIAFMIQHAGDLGRLSRKR